MRGITMVQVMGAAYRLSPTMRVLLADIVRDGPTYTERVEWSTVRALWRRRLIEQMSDGRWRATQRGSRLIQDSGEPEPVALVWARSRPLVAGDATGVQHLVEDLQVGTGQAALCGTTPGELARWTRPDEGPETPVVCLRCAHIRRLSELRRTR